MRLIQFRSQTGMPRVAIVCDAETVAALPASPSLYELAQRAIRAKKTLVQLLETCTGLEALSYPTLIESGRILPPILHPDPAHLLVTGTGLTHLGSASARNQMHVDQRETLTDSMRMFQWGIAGGKPAPGKTGVQPEWFYKGDGSSVAAPYQPLSSPDFALDRGEEPEIVGIYLIGPTGDPYRLGFALGNEFSDHITEKQNYLYLAHSKLRSCAFGPELLLGELPASVEGTVRIHRKGKIHWEKPFLSGEANMSHSIANLAHHHFKYPQFRRPGDVHVHFFGTATLSFADDIHIETGDEIEIAAAAFGRPLRNPVQTSPQQPWELRSL